MTRLSALTLRTRLVAGFTAAMLVVLTGAGVFVYWRVQYALDRGLDTDLGQAEATIAPLVTSTGTISNPVAAKATGVDFQVVDSDGRVTAMGGAAGSEPYVSRATLARVNDNRVEENVGGFLPASAQPLRLQIVRLQPGGQSYFLVLGVRRSHRDEALRELLLQLSVAGVVTILITAAVGGALAQAALRPVERYRRRAAAIAGGASGLRLDVSSKRSDEVTRLGETLNEMLAALEHALDHERHFVNDASHELRTPVTLLKSRIQLARRRARSSAEHEQILDELAIDVARLSDLADQLLAIGTIGSNQIAEADVSRVVAGIIERRRIAGPEHDQEISVELPVGPAVVSVDPRVLERALTNLIDNALLHGHSPTHVRVSEPVAVTAATARTEHLEAPSGWVVVSVEDAGTGMTADLLEQATGRFIRSPEARSRPGAGLGLALVEEIAARSGGELRLCFGGVHTSHAGRAPVVCQHSAAMTASLILPAVN